MDQPGGTLAFSFVESIVLSHLTPPALFPIVDEWKSFIAQVLI